MKVSRITTAVLAALTLGNTAMAASSGTLLLQGQVSTVTNITVAPTDNLALNIVNGEAGKDVASVIEESNNLGGYKVFISSTNGGELRHTLDASKKTTYQIKYDGSAAAVTPSVTQVGQNGVEVKNVTSLSGLTTDTSSVLAVVAPYASAPAGTYNDTLTISIVAN